jgi:hypothetical protein
VSLALPFSVALGSKLNILSKMSLPLWEEDKNPEVLGHSACLLAGSYVTIQWKIFFCFLLFFGIKFSYLT